MAIFERQPITGGMQDANSGVTPDGKTIYLPVPGEPEFTQQPLMANEEWVSELISYNGNEAVHFYMQSDVPGVYTIEYFKDGVKIPFAGNPTAYDPNSVPAFQAALSGKADAITIRYKNGSINQSVFCLGIKIGNQIQATMRSMGVPMSSTNMGSSVHSAIEGRPQNGAGNYSQVTTTTTGSKVALDVSVPNLTNGAQTVQIVDGNNQTRGVDALPFKVQFPANYTPPTTPVTLSGNPDVKVTFPTTQPVSATSLPLPTGASTSALQTTGNISLSNIDADLGSPTDPVVTDATQTATVTSLLKGILQKGIAPATASTFQDIALAANVAQTIPANVNRKGIIVSSSSGTILIGIGYVPTVSRWSYRIVTNGSFDIPEHWAPLSVSLLSTTSATATATLIT